MDIMLSMKSMSDIYMVAYTYSTCVSVLQMHAVVNDLFKISNDGSRFEREKLVGVIVGRL